MTNIISAVVTNHCQRHIGCEKCPAKETCEKSRNMVGKGWTEQDYINGMTKIIEGLNDE